MDEFHDAIAKITIAGINSRGTGFLVTKDGLVATALHVVASRATDPPIFPPGAIRLGFRGYSTTAKLLKWNLDADCALLQCDEVGPLSDYPFIPLRELNQSDDLFKARGYPDAQPVNGTTWGGKVRAYTEELTNVYATRTSVYRPVLQLMCEEAGAGTGAPPKGMSGAPVVIGSAAVGLLRFALMQDGRTVAATLYACNAKDIADLDPQRLRVRPQLAAIVIITPDQMAQLTPILVGAFSEKLGDLRRAMRYSLGSDAERSVVSAKNVEEYVSLLLPTQEQQGPGTIGVLLRGAMTARPVDGRLREFLSENFSYALEPVNDDPDVQKAHDEKLVREIRLALIALNDMKHVSGFQQIIATYRPEFEATRRQIEILARYKELHSILHEIQERLHEISRAIERFASGDNVESYLKDYYSLLKKSTTKARSQAAGLPTPEDERDWIDKLDACAADVRAATESVSEKILGVPNELNKLLPNATRINGELVRAAKQVRLDNFAETMRSVEQRFGATMKEGPLRSLKEGSLAVGRLRPRLAGLIAEHDEWQHINTDFEWTKTQNLIQPPARFSSWKQTKTRLLSLCDSFPEEEWSIDLKEMMKPWMADEPPPEPTVARNIAKINEAFQRFHKQCIERFIEVDRELNTLCGKVTTFTDPLDALLQG